MTNDKFNDALDEAKSGLCEAIGEDTGKLVLIIGIDTNKKDGCISYSRSFVHSDKSDADTLDAHFREMVDGIIHDKTFVMQLTHYMLSTPSRTGGARGKGGRWHRMDAGKT